MGEPGKLTCRQQRGKNFVRLFQLWTPRRRRRRFHGQARSSQSGEWLSDAQEASVARLVVGMEIAIDLRLIFISVYRN